MRIKSTITVYPHCKPNEEPYFLPYRSSPSSEYDQENYGVCLDPDGLKLEVAADVDCEDPRVIAKENHDRMIETLRAQTEEKIGSIKHEYQKWLAITAQ